MNHQEYVLNLIKKKYIITKPPVRAILNHALTSAQYRGLYVEFNLRKTNMPLIISCLLMIM